MNIFALTVALTALLLSIICLILIIRHHKLLKGLPQLIERLEKIAEELEVKKIVERLEELSKEVKDNAKRFYARRVILSRIFERMEEFAKVAKKLAQIEKPEDIPEEKGDKEDE